MEILLAAAAVCLGRELSTLLGEKFVRYGASKSLTICIYKTPLPKQSVPEAQRFNGAVVNPFCNLEKKELIADYIPFCAVPRS
jgi:hypothetical protein